MSNKFKTILNKHPVQMALKRAMVPWIQQVVTESSILLEREGHLDGQKTATQTVDEKGKSVKTSNQTRCFGGVHQTQ